ncbi:MAG: aldehyde ferredoxin oxidoreductase C-terminal domain-containing protein [Desulfatiglandales bacterium]
MKGGYAGKVLYVDLTSDKISEEGLPDENVLKAWLGCYGMGLKMLYDMTPPGVSARDPENPLIFWTGPLTATDMPGHTNLSLATKNFNNDLTAGRSHAHGELGIKLKKAGFDGLVITGCSEGPKYLFIHDDGVELRDASSLWGKDTHETEDILQDELGATASVAAIGPVGENLCAGGMICSDRNHNMAHSGGGSVMGSKRLKAIVFQGNKDFPIAHPEKIKDIRKRWVQLVKEGHRFSRGGWGKFHNNEMRYLLDGLGFAGKNFQINKFKEFAVGLSNHKITPRPCKRCPYGCPVDIELVSGPHKGLVATLCGGGEGPEGAGAVLGIGNPEHWVYLLEQYDRLGVESSLFGCTLAMATEAYEKGLITDKDTDGIELKWGDPDVAEKMLQKFAHKEGFGALLAKGPLEAARAIGGDASNFAVHLKGSGINLHDWRSGWGMLLCHVISGGSGWPATAADSIGWEPDAGYPEFTDPFDHKAKPQEARKTGILKYMRDANGTCGFMTWNIGGSTEIVREAINAVTGWDMTTEELWAVGERMMHLERAFNCRHGLTPEDDYNLSPRLLEAPQDGRAKGRAVEPYLRGMVDEYYSLMGWDKTTGKPLEKTLKRFGLDDIAKDLWG